jgi:hypothetical protein
MDRPNVIQGLRLAFLTGKLLTERQRLLEPSIGLIEKSDTPGAEPITARGLLSPPKQLTVFPLLDGPENFSQ